MNSYVNSELLTVAIAIIQTLINKFLSIGNGNNKLFMKKRRDVSTFLKSRYQWQVIDLKCFFEKFQKQKKNLINFSQSILNFSIFFSHSQIALTTCIASLFWFCTNDLRFFFQTIFCKVKNSNGTEHMKTLKKIIKWQTSLDLKTQTTLNWRNAESLNYSQQFEFTFHFMASILIMKTST